MNNLYLIESDNPKVIDKKLSDLLKDKKENLITYDMEEVNISTVINELDTYGFWNEEKIVYAKNANFLSSSKSEIEHDLDALTKYLNNPNPSNILIISCSKIDGKKNISKLVKKTCEIIDSNIDINSFIKEKCQDIKIDNNTINYLLENTGNDLERINNELDKLLNFCEKEITKKDIDLIVIKKIDANIFDLIDAIINKDKTRSLRIYEEMINYGEDIFKIFVSLANQIRLIYQVKVLSNLSNEEIAGNLNLKNPKQVMAIRYKINKYRESDLLDYLYKLSIMDEELKLGKSIDKIVFPTFIASL